MAHSLPATIRPIHDKVRNHSYLLIGMRIFYSFSIPMTTFTYRAIDGVTGLPSLPATASIFVQVIHRFDSSLVSKWSELACLQASNYIHGSVGQHHRWRTDENIIHWPGYERIVIFHYSMMSPYSDAESAIIEAVLIRAPLFGNLTKVW